MRRNYLVKQYCLQRLAMPVDILHTMCYITCNIPAKPLPQGKRNLAGLFLGLNNGRL